MNNREILVELKKSYEYLCDIIENQDGQLKQREVDRLKDAKNHIENVYFDFWHRLYQNDNIIDLILKNQYQKDNDRIIYIGSDVNIDYTIKFKDSDLHERDYDLTCEDIDYCWYQDREFINEGWNK